MMTDDTGAEAKEATDWRPHPLVMIGMGAFFVVFAYMRYRHLARHAKHLDPSVPLDAEVIFLYKIIGWPVMGLVALVGLYFIVQGFRRLRARKH